MARPRFEARRLLGEKQAALADLPLPLGILGRIDDVDAAGDDRNRAGFKRSVVRSRIDAARQARDDRDILHAQPLRKLAREAAGRGGGVARADHGDGAFLQKVRVSQHRDDRRRVVDVCQRQGVVGLA